MLKEGRGLERKGTLVQEKSLSHLSQLVLGGRGTLNNIEAFEFDSQLLLTK